MIIENLERLKETELIAANYEAIRALLKQMQRFIGITYVLHPWEKIIRGRPIKANERLVRRSDFSYKPQQLNTTYQRASTPFATMFYGSIFPDEINPMESRYPRVTVLFELFDFMRDLNTERKSHHVNFSVWKNKKQLNLLCICQYQGFKAPSKTIQNIYDEYAEYVAKFPESERKAIEETTAFISGHFSNPDITRHTDYMISAIFTEVVTELGFDGILYPSVRMDGGGLNIAITPKAVHKKLTFLGSGECCIYKYKENAYLNNLTQANHIIGKSLKYSRLRFPDTLNEDDCWRAVTEPGFLPVG